MKLNPTFFLAGVFVLASATVAWSANMPGPRFESGGVKKGKYITEGFFAGGQRSVNAVKLKDIRRASQAGFERVVFDLVPGTEDRVSIPYYQVQAASSEGRVIVSIWADVQYDFDIKHVQKSFGKSPHVKQLNVLPRLEDGLATVELQLNGASKSKKPAIEVFHLANPSRIILDIRS